MAENQDNVLTIEELDLYLKNSKSTLYKLAQKGEVPGQKVGKHWRFRRDIVNQWLADSHQTTIRQPRGNKMPDKEQKFLDALDKKLWNAADKLRSTLDAAQYKHAVLGLLFVKYVSDAFDIKRQELIAQFKELGHDYFLGPDEADKEFFEQTESFKRFQVA